MIVLMAAIITPPDIVSQIMVAIPMIGLYELSVLLSRLVFRRRKNAPPEQGAGEAAEA